MAANGLLLLDVLDQASQEWVGQLDREAVIETALKGGQMGSERYVASVAAGSPLA